jgi:hypothetical protein
MRNELILGNKDEDAFSEHYIFVDIALHDVPY